MFFVPRRIYHVIIACAIIAVLLSILIQNYWIIAGVILLVSVERIKNWFGRNKKTVDVFITHVGIRKEDKDLHNFMQTEKESVGQKPFDLIQEIEGASNKSFSIYGKSRGGKSVLGEELCKLYGEMDAIPYGKDEGKEIGIVVIDLKDYSIRSRDYLDLEFDVIWMDEHIPNPFSVSVEDFAMSWKTAIISNVNLFGLTAQQIEPFIRKIKKLQPKSWEEFEDFLKNERKKRDSDISRTAIEIILNQLEQLKLAAHPIDINFKDHNYVLKFGKLPDVARIFYGEITMRSIYRSELDADDNKILILAIDEAHKILRFSDAGSIVSTLLVEGAVAMRFWIFTQSYSSIAGENHQFGCEFQYHTGNPDDYPEIEKASGAMMKDVVRLLGDYEFVNLHEKHENKVITVRKLNIDRLEEFKRQNKISHDILEKTGIITPYDIITPEDEVIASSPIPKKPEPKLADEIIYDRIIQVIKPSKYALFGNEITKKLGFEDDSIYRLQVNKILKNEITKDDAKIRLAMYVTERLREDQQPRKYYYVDPVGDESQIHRTGNRDIKNVCMKINESITAEGLSNQGWDLEITRAYLDFKTGLENSIREVITKIRAVDKFAIIVCMNYDVKARYENAFSLVEDIEGKYRVCCLNELAKILKELKNEQDKTV